MTISLHKFSNFGIQMLKSRYVLKNVTPEQLFERVINAYSDNSEHAKRIAYYIENLHFMPATPILSNGGTNRGLPISCFLNQMEDSLKSIAGIWNQNIYLASSGGGIGTDVSSIRSIGEDIADKGTTAGVIPFIKVSDSLTLAISQGSLRRGSTAVYMSVCHPEIEEFVDIRKPTGGDPSRKCLNIHHGVSIPDAFMKAVETNAPWNLISPSTKKVLRTISARDLWIRILTTRLETGEPYLLFIDNVKKDTPFSYKALGLNHRTSNLCSEITLTTGKDHIGNERTAVCCLSSLNLEYYDEWKDNENIVEDVMRFLDNVLDDFIKRAPQEMNNATYSALRERSVGLGVMGFHSFLQKKLIPFESATTKSYNKQIFSMLRERADKASLKLAQEKMPCPDSFEALARALIDDKKIHIDNAYLAQNQKSGFQEMFEEFMVYKSSPNGSNFKLKPEDLKIIGHQIAQKGERFTHKLAIAPTASISNLCGDTSAGIEPRAGNTMTVKNLTGSNNMRNVYLQGVLDRYGKNTESVWQSIVANEGSVLHLDFLSTYEKQVFKTAFEIDQSFLVHLACERTPFICQAQSLNIFLPSDVSKTDLHKIHFLGWQNGLKSFYYNRSRSISRGEKINQMAVQLTQGDNECIACQ
jgi:ribonucleoside-diphosphate reductase alpha chain